MRIIRNLGVLVLLMTGGARCGDGPAPADRPTSSPDTITGRERLGWTQPAPDASELAAYRYAIYVDGVRQMLAGETCARTSGPGGFECSAPLPALSPGRRTLELAVVVIADGQVLEGPRSAPLQVTVGRAAHADASGARIAEGPLVGTDGVTFESAILHRDLVDPVDLAAAPDGRTFVMEGGGSLHVAPAPGRPPRDGSPQDLLLDLGEGPDARILSLALSGDYERSGRVFVAYRSPAPGGTTLRIARFREAGGVLGEAAVLAAFAVPGDAGATLRVGPDNLLYVGVGAGAGEQGAQDLSSVAGKILRVDADGRPSRTNPWGSEVYTVGHRDPGGLVWDVAARRLWMSDRAESGDEINLIHPGANYGWPAVTGGREHPFVTPPALVLPRGAAVAGLATVTTPSHPLRGELFAAAAGLQDLLRLSVDPRGRLTMTARLLQGRFGRVAQVASAPDGALLFITRNGAGSDGGGDLLVRLTVPSRP